MGGPSSNMTVTLQEEETKTQDTKERPWEDPVRRRHLQVRKKASELSAANYLIPDF
jgi:hypothetical protein